MVIFLALAALALCFFGSTEPARADDPAYLQELLRRADAAELHQQRYWHLLLHYRRNFAGGHESEVDEAGFFLSPEGKNNPQAELQATIRQFFSTALVGRSRQPARCAFIARYHWLKQSLNIDEARLPPQACERFQAWLKELNPASITLIFPSAFMNNPSSMFGHLLLRVDQRGQTEQTRLLAYTINYSADVTTDNGILFAVLGVFGGFSGYFSTHPYYIKAREYGDFENRDIWEYRLNLTDEQIGRMLMHAWELGNAAFDYFFFKENCAYHILSLIDVADPEIRLTDRFWLYTFPSDGARMIAERPGLVKEVIFRPARSTLVRRGRESLADEERVWVNAIVADPGEARAEGFTRLAPQRQARVLDVASDYLLYQAATRSENEALYQQRNRAVLLARSRLRAPPAGGAPKPFTGPPDQGHRIMRAGIGGGFREGEGFGELNFRLAFHDLLDPEYGYTPDAQIEALGVSLRHYFDRGHTRIDRFTLLNILSLAPVNALFFSPSWKVSTGFDTIRRNGCRFCRAGNFNAGIGLAGESTWWMREVFYAFGDFSAEYGRVFDSDYRVGGGASAGALIDLTDRWKLGLSAGYLEFPAGDRSGEWRIAAHQRYAINRNLAVRFEFNRRGGTREVLLNLQAYF